MTSGRDPWADPNTPTEPGAPYAGPPATAPPAYGPPASPYGPYGYAGYPPPGYGYPPPWPVVPRPRRPGQVIASAVLAFVQGALVLIASLYVYFAASIVSAVTAAGAPEDLDADALATEGTVLAAVQVLSAVLLVTAGVLALNRRRPGTWLTLVVAHAVQLVLALYWWARLVMLANEFPDGDVDGVLLGFPLFFAAGPAVGLGLAAAGAGRRWFVAEKAPVPTAA